MGPYHIPCEGPSRASVHAIHVWRRRADIQHGNRHGIPHAVQEHCEDEYGRVSVLVRLHHPNIPAQCLLHSHRRHLVRRH